MADMTGWNTTVVRRLVPEPDRMRAEALRLKGQADRLMRKADELTAAAEKLEMDDQSQNKRLD
jgi:hypothetical protein